MTVNEFYAKLDALPSDMADNEKESFIIAACSAYDAENPDDWCGRCAMYNELGSFYRARGIWDKGEEAFLKAKRLLEDGSRLVEIASGCACCGGDECDMSNSTLLDLITTPDYATTLNNLAGLYRMSGRRTEAMDTFVAARVIYNACPETPADVVASCSNNLGLLYLDEKRWDEAMECFESALKTLGDMENDFARGTTLSNIGFANLGMGKKAEAAASMRSAAELFANCDKKMEGLCLQYAAKIEDSLK